MPTRGVTTTTAGPAPPTSGDGVDLYWLPLGGGSGDRCVRGSGRLYERLVSTRGHRAAMDLYHSALVVHVGGATSTIEMTPVWTGRIRERGVVGEGPVGLPVLGRSRLFRYEVRCWRDGVIPDLAASVDSPRRVSHDRTTAERVLRLAPQFPLATWGLDEQRTGEMWNSNSLTAWLLAGSGLDLAAPALQPPPHGRAPGWSAGRVVAERNRGRRTRPVEPVGRGL